MACRWGSKCKSLNGGVCGKTKPASSTSIIKPTVALSDAEEVSLLLKISHPAFLSAVKISNKILSGKQISSDQKHEVLTDLGFTKKTFADNTEYYEYKFSNESIIQSKPHGVIVKFEKDASGVYRDAHMGSYLHFHDFVYVQAKYILSDRLKQSGKPEEADRVFKMLDDACNTDSDLKDKAKEDRANRKINSLAMNEPLKQNIFFKLLQKIPGCHEWKRTFVVKNQFAIKRNGLNVAVLRPESAGSKTYIFSESLPMTKESLVKLGLKF